MRLLHWLDWQWFFISRHCCFKTISYAGCHLGFNAIRSKGGVEVRIWRNGKCMAICARRFLISLLSPKIALFFIALFSQFVAVGHELSSKSDHCCDAVCHWRLVVYLYYLLAIKSTHFSTSCVPGAVLIDRLSGIVCCCLLREFCLRCKFSSCYFLAINTKKNPSMTRVLC